MSNTKKKFRPTVSYTNKSGQSTTFEAPKYRLIKRKIKSYIGESADGVVNVTRYRRGQDGVYQESWQLNPTNHKLRAVVSGNFTNQSSPASATSTPVAQSSPTTSQQSPPPSSAYSTAVPQNNVRQITSTTNNTTIPNNV
jgi:hypothetical protein